MLITSGNNIYKIMLRSRNTYSYEKSTNERSEKMLKTGQVPMDVNAMPGLVSEESEDKSKEIEGGINELQGGDACFFCQKPGHVKKDCLKYEDWEKKNSNRKTGSSFWKPISCYNCGKEGHNSRECKSERKNSRRRDTRTSRGGQMAEMVQTAVQEVLKKLAPDTVLWNPYPYFWKMHIVCQEVCKLYMRSRGGHQLTFLM